ncbi:RNA-directed DNA polymerase from mobile element jockey [Lucilia cuprina]|nr:RNA-directed DNA polymerase from mobile element jockey [Lucilia cuprina]
MVREFGRHFSRIYSANLPSSHAEVDNEIRDFLVEAPSRVCSFDNDFGILDSDDNAHFTNSSGLVSLIRTLNAKKSAGIDNVSNYLLRKLSTSALDYLSTIFNNCINNGYFPDRWKIAKIIPLRKKPNVYNIDNSRPISMLSNLGKLFERVIRSKMDLNVDFEYIPHRQFGFRKGHSSSHALLKFHDDVIRNLEVQRCTVAVSLDIEKAFDRAYQNGIILKLIRIGFDPFIVRLLISFFRDRYFFVQMNQVLSQQEPVYSGVPQGSILAPLLYSILVYDFPHCHNGSDSILYADDSLIYAHHTNPVMALERVSEHLKIIDDFYRQWGVRINPGKSEAICLRNASGKCPHYVVPLSRNLRLTLDDREIPFKDRIRYLGVEFTNLFKFNVHAREAAAKAKRVRLMFSKLLLNRHLSRESKLLIYKVSIRTILVYGYSVWFTISPTVARELEIVERSILRLCVGRNFESRNKRFSNKFIYKESNVIPLCFYALALMRNFSRRLQFHTNPLITDIYNHRINLGWSDSIYISPIGVLKEDIDFSDGLSLLPEFYRHSDHTCHRG